MDSYKLSMADLLRTANTTENDLIQHLKRLTTGVKSTEAKDSPTDVITTTKLNNQISSAREAIKNVQNAISTVQGFEDTVITGIREDLYRIKDIATTVSTNGTLSDTQKAEYQTIVNDLTDNIDHLASGASFISPSTATVILSKSNMAFTFSFGDPSTAGLGLSVDVTSQTAATTSLTSINTAIETVDSMSNVQNRDIMSNLKSIAGMSSFEQNQYQESKQQITSIDTALETAGRIKKQIANFFALTSANALTDMEMSRMKRLLE